MKRTLIATASFGLEAVVRREIEALGYPIQRTEDGKVTYMADERGIVRSNLWLRSADRVLLKVAEFPAVDFESLFQQTLALPWEEWIPVDGRFVVTCSTVKSKLHNEPACQRTVKKAIVNRLQEFYVTEHLPETAGDYTVKITLLKDRVTLTIDTTGIGLHKRGYRTSDVAAPLKETMAAALIQLSFWNKDRILVDPCCGSGTIPIEAALIGLNIAPGLSRSFACMDWEWIPDRIWKEERAAAFAAIRQDVQLQIKGSDLDPRAVHSAMQNAQNAGVAEQIIFRRADISSLQPSGQRGVIVTNLPYGVRIGDEDTIRHVNGVLHHFLQENPDWNLFAITADKRFEKAMGRKADRRRKLYNGNIETTYYQFHGKK